MFYFVPLSQKWYKSDTKKMLFLIYYELDEDDYL